MKNQYFFGKSPGATALNFVVITLVSLFVLNVADIAVKSLVDSRKDETGSLKVVLISKNPAEKRSYSLRGKIYVKGDSISKSVNVSLNEDTNSKSVTLKNLLTGIYSVGVEIYGVSVEAIRCAQDRDYFDDSKVKISSGKEGSCAIYLAQLRKKQKPVVSPVVSPDDEKTVPNKGRCNAQGKCDSKSEKGAECVIDGDCKIGGFRSLCINRACVERIGQGSDRCEEREDCFNKQYYGCKPKVTTDPPDRNGNVWVDVLYMCELVTGSGWNTCDPITAEEPGENPDCKYLNYSYILGLEEEK